MYTSRGKYNLSAMNKYCEIEILEVAYILLIFSMCGRKKPKLPFSSWY